MVANLLQTDDTEYSKRSRYTHCCDLEHFNDIWFGKWGEVRHTESLGRQKAVLAKAQNMQYRFRWGIYTTDNCCSSHWMAGYNMRGGIDEKFRGLSAIGGGSMPVRVLRGAWLDKYFWVGARRLMPFETTRIAINILKGHQTLAMYTPDGLTCQWNVFSGGVGSSEVKWHENSAVFFLFFFSGRREKLS